MSKLPNPGSPQAIEAGCDCPIIDNRAGRGFMNRNGEPVFVLNADCPLHNPKEVGYRKAAALSTDAEPVEWQRKTIDFGWMRVDDEDLPHCRERGVEPRALYAEPVKTAPAVAVKALKMADETFRDLGWHDKYEATTAALAALSAQVQDVAGSKPLDLDISKEWFEKRAVLEGNHEIGAGSRKKTVCIDPTPDELSELFRIAHRIPEGWKLVPKEATREQLNTVSERVMNGEIDDRIYSELYEAFIAAAPAAKKGKGEAE